MSEAYRRSGVDLGAAARAVERIRDIAAGAARPETVAGVGGFAGLYDLGDGRLAAAAADGAGTKVEVAREAGRLGSIGIDLVAMSANDVVCTGAEPLFFLDHIVVGRLVPDEVAALVSGVAEGCRRAGCALLGGETADHPDLLPPGAFDLAGFCVGVVGKDDVLGSDRVHPGDALLGLPSTGLHANGFSLVRRVVADAGLGLDHVPDEVGRPLADELLEPTAIYVADVLALADRGLVRSVAHVTGGGLPGNLPRALPAGLGAELDRGAWGIPPVFRFLQRAGGLTEADLLSTFNLGVGMALVVAPEAVEEATSVLEERGAAPIPLGRVAGGEGVRW